MDILMQAFQLLIVVPVAIILQAVFSVIPDMNFLSSATSPIHSAFVWFFGIMASLDPIFPYSVQLSILSIIITFYGTLFTFKLVSWILRKVPFLGLS